MARQTHHTEDEQKQTAGKQYAYFFKQTRALRVNIFKLPAAQIEKAWH
jgi:hypothetical protein